ncbi:MAG TPA: hypothetical protein DCS41_09670 [Gammaproteobacteria bacterium]|nr:hypothetical protein [Gammaproteobacteria bacterium]
MIGLSRVASPVNVVTTDGQARRSSVTVSAGVNGPIIQVCLHHLGRSVPVIIENRVFAVNVLREDQVFISEAFAGRQ